MLGKAFLAEVLVVELGITHAWEFDYKDVLCVSDCLLCCGGI